MQNNIYKPKQEMYISGDEKGNSGPSGGKSNFKNGLIFVIVVIVIIGLVWFVSNKSKDDRQGELIEIENNGSAPSQEILNEGEVSPITGLACENWNRRPMAVMQPSDAPARPAAGFSDADMVIEMPVITASITRLMGIYICGNPEDVGSMRSSRHDFLHLAKGLDAIYVHWGGSSYAKEKLNEGVIDNINCNDDGGKSGSQCCFRKEGMSRGVDSGYAKFDKLLECSEDFGYRMEGEFGGYAHQADAPESDRPLGGNLRVGFAGVSGVNYEYDKKTNSYLRFWGGEEDFDRNNDKRHAPKNVVVMMALSEQIAKGEQYNNIQIGDPWYDKTDSGEAYYYINGQQIKGTWKKSKTRIDSKLVFSDQNGSDIEFVPGQIWVEVLEPGQGLKWRPIEAETEIEDGIEE